MLVFYVGIFAEMKVIGAIFVNGITFSKSLFSVPAIFFCYFYSPLHMMIGVMINFYEAVTWKKIQGFTWGWCFGITSLSKSLVV